MQRPAFAFPGHFCWLLLVTALNAAAAPGDIVSATLETNGWVLDVAIQGMTTNGTYNFGLGTNNTLTGNEKVRLTLTSMGFDDAGAPTTVSRTIYGTFALRFPYPNQAFKDQVIAGGVLTNKVVMSDYIYARDSNLVVQITAGYYAISGQNNSATVSVANLSMLPYQKPIANWTWPGWSRITGTNFQLRAVAFHQHARQGRPARLVRFMAQDGHNHFATNDVLNMSLDRSIGDQLPFGEYIGNLPSGVLTQGDVITNSFQAFPWIGDTPLDSNDGKNSQPTPLYSRLYLLNDKTGGYGSTVAVVSPSGNDSLGVAIDSSAFNAASQPGAFLTIAGAANAIAATNLILHARNDTGGGVVYLRAGAYSWLGPNAKSYGQTPNAYCEVTTYPGDIQATINAANSGNNTLSDKVKLSNLGITAPTSAAFTGGTYLWFDRCVFNSTSQSLIYNVPVWYVTRCNIQSLQQALGPFSIQNSATALVRGSAISNLPSGCYPYTLCGCAFNQALPGAYLSTDITSGRQIPYPDGAVIYNNCFYRISAVVGTVLDSYYQGWTNGLAFIQNLIECSTNGSRQLIAISGQTGTETPVNNVIFWHNDVLGRGADLAFNNYDTEYCQRVYWSLKNNLFDKLDIKTDTGDNPNGIRTGDWSEVFGVGYSGNFNANISGVSASGSFNPEFCGLCSFQPAGGGTVASGFFGFANCQAFNGIVNGLGNGDYHLATNSPALAMSYDWVLPFDVDGKIRGTGNAAGIYASGSARSTQLTMVNPHVAAENQFQFTIMNSLMGTTNIIEVSTNLPVWMPLATNAISVVPWTYTDTNTPGYSRRCYRVVWPGTP